MGMHAHINSTEAADCHLSFKWSQEFCGPALSRKPLWLQQLPYSTLLGSQATGPKATGATADGCNPLQNFFFSRDQFFKTSQKLLICFQVQRTRFFRELFSHFSKTIFEIFFLENYIDDKFLRQKMWKKILSGAVNFGPMKNSRIAFF